MRSILRKAILASVFGAAVALAGNSAMAATRVNVPFNFTVAGKRFPLVATTSFTIPAAPSSLFVASSRTIAIRGC